MPLYDTAPTTQMREYYDALGSMGEKALVAEAEMLANDPSAIAVRFETSVDAVGNRPPVDEGFYPARRPPATEEPRKPGKISSTVEFTRLLRNGGEFPVEGAAALAFRYVDREISPARTTGTRRSPRRALDLLLANTRDDLPVLAELKIENDRPTYFGLIQILMVASEFQSDAQRRRLKAHPGGETLRWPGGGPFVDLYIVGFSANMHGTYRQRSFDATEIISEKLLRNDAFSRHVRRIAYLEAALSAGGLTFEKRFAFGPGV